MGRMDTGPNERWFFYQDAANLWKWARLDLLGTVLAYSGGAFAARETCVEDARRCGFRETSLAADDFGTIGGDPASPPAYAHTHRV